MFFTWLKRRRRNKLLVDPFPKHWLDHLDRSPHVRVLPPSLRRALFDAIRIFLAEKEWEGCKGLTLTEEMKVLIAGQACILTLGMPDYYFDNVQTILVYPSGFRVRQQVGIGGGAILDDVSDRLGEAHLRGPVILSWREIEEDMAQPGFGRNLVFHEFAHQIDMLDGDIDGVPPLPRTLRKSWETVMGKEYDELQRAARRGDETLIDDYGAESPAEFFAVVTETFFDNPIDLRIEHRELYDVLAQFYRLDPASWWPK